MPRREVYTLWLFLVMDGLMLLAGSENGETNVGNTSKFALDHDVNAKLYLWRGTPWALEVDAVVNSSNEVCCFRSASFNILVGCCY
jgi:hypothetical protein